MNEQEEVTLSKKYKSFKGIRIERTGDYFICDFYRLEQPGNTISYMVNIELGGVKQNVILKATEDNNWKYVNAYSDLPAELEEALSDHIVKSCL